MSNIVKQKKKEKEMAQKALMIKQNDFIKFKSITRLTKKKRTSHINDDGAFFVLVWKWL